VALKEASGKLEQLAEIIAQTPPSFRVYSGEASATLPLKGLGAYGVISVVAHIAGQPIKQMIEAFAAGRVAEAAELHGRLLPLFQACFCTTNPIPIKAAVTLLNLPAGSVRLPLVPADEKVIATVRAAMQNQGLL